MSKTLKRKELLKIYLWTLSYFKPVLFLTCIYVLCGGAMIGGELMIPRRMGYLIDHILPQKSTALLMQQMFLLIGIVLFILLAKALFNYLEVVLSNRITQRQQVDLLLKLQTLGFSYYEKVPTGQIVSLFENSVKETQKTYTFLFPHFIYSLAQFAVPSLVLLLSEPIFFVATMIGNVIYIGLNHFTNKNIEYYLGVETKAAQSSQQLLYDCVTATNEMKAMGSQDWYIEKTMAAFNAYRIPKMWSVFWRHVRFTTVGLTLTVSVVLFYFYGLDLVKSGDLLLGEFIGYSFLMGLVSRGFSVFFYIIPAQLHALNYAKHLYDFMALQPDVEEVKHALDPDLEHFDIVFNQVSFAYNDAQPLLKDLSFVIPAGKKTAIVGESGCGKSTLLKLIGRFYDVIEGEITLGGHDVKTFQLTSLRQHFGYVFQETYLLNESIKEIIRFGKREATDDEIVAAAKGASAHAFIEETEAGYDTMVGERGVRLSGGQKQRLSLARLLLKAPQILLLDEATSALDNVTEATVKASLDDLSAGRTLVAVAHRLSTIKDYDSIIVLNEGKIAEQGSYESLMAREGLFYRLVMRGDDHVA